MLSHPFPVSVVSSPRLVLIPFTLEFMRSSLAHDTVTCSRILGATVPPEWPGDDYLHVLHLRISQLETDPTLMPWLMRAMVERTTGTMVGDIGFHTPPRPGYLAPYSANAIEFGFGVFTPYRRLGYAREAATAMMQWACSHHRVGDFILSIRPDNTPSQALAAQLGFTKIGSHIDEIDGAEDVLIHRMNASHA